MEVAELDLLWPVPNLAAPAHTVHRHLSFPSAGSEANRLHSHLHVTCSIKQSVTQRLPVSWNIAWSVPIESPGFMFAHELRDYSRDTSQLKSPPCSGVEVAWSPQFKSLHSYPVTCMLGIWDSPPIITACQVTGLKWSPGNYICPQFK